MGLDDTVVDQWERLARTCFRHKSGSTADFSNYEGFDVLETWRSNHAEFARFKLTKSERPSSGGRLFVLKHFIPPRGSHESVYAAYHQPSSLWPREVRNLRHVRAVLEEGYSRSFAHTLVPYVAGSYAEPHFALVLPFISGDNYKRRILHASNDRKGNVFLDGIRLNARFVGTCNAHQDMFNTRFNYRADAFQQREVQHSLLKENIARVIYDLDSGCREFVKKDNADQLGGGNEQTYSIEPVFRYISSVLNINLDQRLREIRDLEKGLCEEEEFQHGDCNGLNMIKNKLIDFEDFGYYPWTQDLSHNCIVIGLGTNAILQHRDFIYFVQAFLAIRAAYLTGDLNEGRTVESFTNGRYGTYVGEKMAGNRYSDFLASFFHRSTEKNLQLAASYSRNERGEQTFDIRSSLSQLYHVVLELTPQDFTQCSQPTQVRELFYATGKLFNELGITRVDEYVLDGIKSGRTTGSAIADGRPAFRH